MGDYDDFISLIFYIKIILEMEHFKYYGSQIYTKLLEYSVH